MKYLFLLSIFLLSACGGVSSDGKSSSASNLDENDFIIGYWAECYDNQECMFLDDDFGRVESNGRYSEYEALSDFLATDTSVTAYKQQDMDGTVKKINDTTYEVHNLVYDGYRVTGNCIMEIKVSEKLSNEIAYFQQSLVNCQGQNGLPETANRVTMDIFWARKYQGEVISQ